MHRLGPVLPFLSVSGKFRVNVAIESYRERERERERDTLAPVLPIHLLRSLESSSSSSWSSSLFDRSRAPFDFFSCDSLEKRERERERLVRTRCRSGETGSGGARTIAGDPIIRSVSESRSRGRAYHKSRLTVGKIFAGATGREFRFFWRRAASYRIHALYVRYVSVATTRERERERESRERKEKKKKWIDVDALTG